MPFLKSTISTNPPFFISKHLFTHSPDKSAVKHVIRLHGDSRRLRLRSQSTYQFCMILLFFFFHLYSVVQQCALQPLLPPPPPPPINQVLVLSAKTKVMRFLHKCGRQCDVVVFSSP